ncbi:MAG: pentapeptide repeat-containing protein [Akkermansiaceae bacterium]
MIFANLSEADLSGADLNGADLNGADLSGVESGNITGTPIGLPTSWQIVNGYLIGPEADLTGAFLSGANLSGADLFGADLINADLIEADLIEADLSDADLSNVDLSNADLSGANFTNTILTDVILTGANLTNVTIGNPVADAAVAGLQAQVLALQAEVDSKLTLQEITDLRPGSSTIEITDGNAQISLTLEESDDLGDTDAWEATGEEATITVPAAAGKKFFRFAK